MDKRKWIYLVICVVVIGVMFLSLIKALDLSPTIQTPLQKQIQVIDQDPYLTEFDIYQVHFKLMDVSCSKSLGTLPEPTVNMYPDTYVVDDHKQILSSHDFLVMTFEITNLTNASKVFDTGNIRLMLMQEGVMASEYEFYSNDLNNSDIKKGRVLALDGNETRTVRLGIVISEEEMSTYDLGVAVNPAGRDYTYDENHIPVMTENFRYFYIEPEYEEVHSS